MENFSAEVTLLLAKELFNKLHNDVRTVKNDSFKRIWPNIRTNESYFI